MPPLLLVFCLFCWLTAPSAEASGFGGTNLGAAGFADPRPGDKVRDRGVHPADGPDADVRIFIDDDLVRLQVVVNLAFLDMLVGAPHERDDWIDPVESAGVSEALFEYLSRVTVVSVGDQRLSATLNHFEIEPPDTSLLPLFPNMGMKALIRMRISLHYPLDTPAAAVTLHWGAYPPDVVAAAPGEEPPPLPITAQLSALGEDLLIPFRADQPDYTWHNTGDRRENRFLVLPQTEHPEDRRTLPLISIALVVAWVVAAFAILFGGPGPGRAKRRRSLWLAAPAVLVFATLSSGLAQVPAPDFLAPATNDATIDDEHAIAVFEALHQNMYRAFDYRDIDKIYDALARSVEGEFLEELFAEVYDSLVLHEDGGAVCRIKEVTPLETRIESVRQVEGQTQVEVLAHWQVFGSVFHWGHSHTRTNDIKARYTLHRGPDGWRIRAHQVLEQRTTDASPERDAALLASPPANAEREL